MTEDFENMLDEGGEESETTSDEDDTDSEEDAGETSTSKTPNVEHLTQT